MKINLAKNEIGIELHYNFTNNDIHSIDFYVRNTCSLAQVEVISYLIKTLYPDEVFEILSLPPQEGSFKDLAIVKLLNETQGVTLAIGTLFTILLFHSQLALNNTTADLNTLDLVEKCKNLNLNDEQIQKVQDI